MTCFPKNDPIPTFYKIINKYVHEPIVEIKYSFSALPTVIDHFPSSARLPRTRGPPNFSFPFEDADLKP